MTLAAERAATSRNVALLMSVLVAVLGASVLGGWALDIAFLKSILPGAVTMKANTAMGMLLTGVALALLSRETVGNGARLFATVVACGGIAMGTLTLGEFFFDWDFGIDQWLFREVPGAAETTHPGRMSPPAAFCFVLMGIALVLASRPFAARFRLPVLSALSVTVILFGGLALLGHLSLALFNIRFWNYAGLAVHTAAGIVLMGCALLAWVRSERGLTWSMDAMTTGGFVVGIVSIVAVAGLSYSFTDELRQDARWVAHSQEVLKEIQELNSSQRDLTLSLGRYLITRDERAVAERVRIKADIQEDTDHVRRLTAGNPRQQSRIDQVEQLTAQRVAMSDRMIEKFRQQGSSAGAPPSGPSATSRGESPLGIEYPKVGQDIDRLLKTMEAEEYALLQQHLALSDFSSARTFLLMPVGVYFSLTMLLLGLFFLNSGTAERKRVEQVRTRLAAIVESSEDAIMGKTLDGVITSWNAGAERMFGYSRQEALGSPMLMLFPPDRLYEEPQIIARVARGESLDHFETVRVRKDGSLIEVAVTISPIKDGSGRIVGASKIARDITERKKAERRIAYLNRVYAVLSGINTLIVRVRDRDELFSEACRIAVEHGQFKMAWIGVADRSAMKIVPVASAGGDVEFLTAVKDRFLLDEAVPLGNSMAARAIRTKKAVVSNDSQNDPTVLFARKRAEAGIHSMAILPLIVADDAVGVLGLYAGEIEFFHAEEMGLLTELAGDIAFAINHIDKQERLDYLAYHDALTGLANRSLFHNRLAHSLHARGGEQPLIATVLLDLERFRRVNETLGRNAGDELLRLVGSRLQRANDTAARFGGDLYGLILRGARTAAEVNRALESIVAACFTEPFALGAAELRLACRAGVALYPGDGADADALLRNAEAALRRSKGTHDRIVFYAPEMNARVAEALAIETKLRRAIERREFVLHYQPKVALASGRIIGAEALIRWQDPDKGLVPPGLFIPVLEETGMIVEVGRWVVEQTFVDMSAWSARGISVPRVAVNVSAIQLQREGFVASMIEEIQRGGDFPEWLELEITESLVMRNVEDSIRKLTVLRDMGVTVAIDDFGTGYSSLSYLSRLPVDALKIDQSFVSGMTSGGNAATIVSTIIALAHGLKLKVVAEGVETAEQSNTLKQLGCDEAQGYLFSKPLPVEQLTKLLEERRTGDEPETS